MTSLPHWSETNTGSTTSSSTSYVNRVSKTFTPGAGEAWPVFFQAQVSLNNTAGQVGVRVTVDGTVKAETLYTPRNTSDKFAFAGFVYIDASGSPSSHTVEIDYKVTNGAHIGTIVGARLDGIGTTATVYFDEETTRQTSSSSTYADASSLGISPGTGDYIILGCVDVDCGNTSNMVRVGLRDTTGPVNQTYDAYHRPSSTSDTWTKLLIWDRSASEAGHRPGTYGAWTSGHTCAMRFAVNANGVTVGVQRMRLLAIPVSAFDEVFSTSLTSDDETATSTTYQDVLTLAPTDVAANDHLVLGSWHSDDTSSSAVGFVQLLDSTASATIAEGARVTQSTTDDRSLTMGGAAEIRTLTAGTRTWKIQKKRDATSHVVRVKIDSQIVAFDLGTSSADQNVGATGLSDPAAFGTPTILAEIAITATGLASAVAFATPVAGNVVSVTGIASTAGFGTPTTAVGAVTVSATGIASATAFGSPTVAFDQAVSLTGVGSGAAIGTATASPGAVTATAAGIGPTATLGSPTATPGAVSASPTGIASTAVLGSLTASATYAASVSGIAANTALGAPILVPGAVTASLPGFGSTVAFGALSVIFTTNETLPVTGIGPTVAFGQPTFGFSYNLPSVGTVVTSLASRTAQTVTLGGRGSQTASLTSRQSQSASLAPVSGGSATLSSR